MAYTTLSEVRALDGLDDEILFPESALNDATAFAEELILDYCGPWAPTSITPSKSSAYHGRGIIRSAGSLAEGGENVIHLKQVAPCIVCSLHTAQHRVENHLGIEGHPRTKTQRTDLETSGPQSTIRHVRMGYGHDGNLPPRGCWAHRDAVSGQGLFGLIDAVGAEVKDRRCQDSIDPAMNDAINEMLQVSDAPGGDNGHIDA